MREHESEAQEFSAIVSEQQMALDKASVFYFNMKLCWWFQQHHIRPDAIDAFYNLRLWEGVPDRKPCRRIMDQWVTQNDTVVGLDAVQMFERGSREMDDAIEEMKNLAKSQ